MEQDLNKMNSHFIWYEGNIKWQLIYTYILYYLFGYHVRIYFLLNLDDLSETNLSLINHIKDTICVPGICWDEKMLFICCGSYGSDNVFVFSYSMTCYIAPMKNKTKLWSLQNRTSKMKTMYWERNVGQSIRIDYIFELKITVFHY